MATTCRETSRPIVSSEYSQFYTPKSKSELSMSEEETTHPSLICAATIKREISYFGMLIGQECTRNHVCFGECGQEKGKNCATFMLSSKASFFCEISQAFDIFATEKNQGILPEEIIWQRWGGEKLIKGENSWELIPRPTVLKIYSFVSRDVSSLARGSYVGHSGNVFGITDTLAF